MKTQDEINKDLAEKDTNESEFQKKVLDYIHPLQKVAADKMCEYHESWDLHDWIYRGYRIKDREDKESDSKKEPGKIIIPVTFAQVQTAVSFLMSTYLQREHFFELRGMGPEDEKPVFAVQQDMSYQLTKNQWPLKLYCWLLDSLKYGFGVIKTDWGEWNCRMRTQRKVPKTSAFSFLGSLGSLFGGGNGNGNGKMEYTTIEEVAEVLEYQGNRIRNISPFSFYPDPDLPIARFQDGAYVFHEEERSLSELKKLEGRDFFGTEHISDTIPGDIFGNRKRRAGRTFGDSDRAVSKMTMAKDKQHDAVIFSETQITLSGRQVKDRFGVDLDKSDYQQKWMIVTGNEDKVIAFKPLGYLHDQYSYDLFEYSPDANAFYNPGLAETVYELQNLMTFFLNSHVVNVKKIVANRFVVNPGMANMEDIESNKNYIRTIGTVPGDLDRVVKQLAVSDVTRGHVSDLDMLLKLLQVVTGISENALGQYSSGRRSATEARNVNAGSAARLKMHGLLGWVQGLEPLGRRMLSNTRQGRTKDVYEQIVGKRALDAPFEEAILADPSKIAGGYDFIPYDATLQSDRQFQAGVLTELFTALISNPNTIMLLQKDPSKLLKYIAELHGIKNIDEFTLAPQQPLNMPQPQVVPDDEAAAAVDAGATPVDVMGNDMMAALSRG